jgi:formylglycine-generating enzyme required for sulfatase activity
MKPRLCLASCFLAALLVVLTDGDVATPQTPKPKDGPLGMKFVPLPKGTFFMGWDGKPGSAKKTDIKEDFEIAIYTVTQGQWTELMGKNPSYFSRQGEGKDRVKDITDEDLKQFPVERVSWFMAKTFLTKLNEKEKGKGYAYRLPTDAEWEYACRGGATTEEECSYHFYFEKPTNELSSKQANFNGNFPFGKGEKGPNLERPTKVGSYAPNRLGLYDMHSNMRQWCEDWKTTQTRVVRGTSYGGKASWGTAAYRDGAGPDIYFDQGIGFRVVRVAIKE